MAYVKRKEKGKIPRRRAEREENQQSVNKSKLENFANLYTRLIRFLWDADVNHFKHF